MSRQKRSRIGDFKPMCDIDWNWPKALDREGVERALKLRFVDEGASIIIAGAHGLGKTMILKNIAHQAILKGHAMLFTSAQKMLTELSSIDSSTRLEHAIRRFAAIREVESAATRAQVSEQRRRNGEAPGEPVDDGSVLAGPATDEPMDDVVVVEPAPEPVADAEVEDLL